MEENEKKVDETGGVTKVPFYLTTWFSVLLFIFAPPLGLVVIWINPKFSKSPRALLTMVIGVWVILWIFLVSNSYLLVQPDQKQATKQSILGTWRVSDSNYKEGYDGLYMFLDDNSYLSALKNPSNGWFFDESAIGTYNYDNKSIRLTHKNIVEQLDYVINGDNLTVTHSPGKADSFSLNFKRTTDTFEKITGKTIEELSGIKETDQVQTLTPTPDPTPVPEPTPVPTVTISQKNALNKAKQYLDYSAFSYAGLIKQLEYEKFSAEDAAYGADNCKANWDQQAAKKAQEYIEYSSFSRDGLIQQLAYEGFTQEQAEFGVSAVGY